MNWPDAFERLLRWILAKLETRFPPLVMNSAEHPRPKNRLTREDVVKLITANGGPVGLDLRNVDLVGADLQHLDLRGVLFSDQLIGSDLSHCNLSGSNLTGAIICNATCVRTHMTKADLRDVDFRFTRFEDAYMRGADLRGADFYRARLLGRTSLLETNMFGASLYLADISGVIVRQSSIGSRIMPEDLRLFKEFHARRRKVTPERYIELETRRFAEAREVYQSLKARWMEEGRYGDASWAFFKERQMAKQTYHPLRTHHYHEHHERRLIFSLSWWKFYVTYSIRWIFAWLAELSCGYGERPLRTVFWAVVSIVSFGFLYAMSEGIVRTGSNSIRWIDYFLYSLASFSTINVADLIAANDIAKVLTSLEALVGIAFLALLMFTLGNRISKS